MKYQSSSRQIQNEALSMSVFCDRHPLSLLRPGLAAAGLVTASDLAFLPNGARVNIAGLKILAHTPLTRSGRRVIFVTLEDETGLMDLAVFSDLQEQGAREILTLDCLAFEAVLNRAGPRGRAISLSARSVIPSWTGRLVDFLADLPNPG